MKAVMLESGIRLRLREEKTRFCEEDIGQKLKGIGNIKTKLTSWQEQSPSIRTQVQDHGIKFWKNPYKKYFKACM